MAGTELSAFGLLDALYAHAPVGLAFWDADGRYARINPALAAINGVAPDDHLGHTAPEILGRSATRSRGSCSG
jgi:PAS domain-containing protein